jgi:integrase
MSVKSRAANGRGHTYKNGNSYRTVIKHQGLVVTASASTIQESRRKAKIKLEEKLNTLKVPILKGSEIRLSDFLFQWLEEEHRHNIAHSTYRRYHSLARCYIKPILGRYFLSELSPGLIGSFLKEMHNQGQSSRSRQQARALLSITLDQAESQELISTNPVKKVKNPVLKSRQISPLSLEEVKRLLETYKGTSLGARLHISLVCGLRQGEALGLTWGDIDLIGGSLVVRRQVQRINGISQFVPLKTERSKRFVALTDETVAALKKHKTIQEEGKKFEPKKQEFNLVFTGVGGEFQTSQADYRDWQTALKLCGIAPKRLHDARHTAATLMHSQGVGIETISRALGHSSSAITSRLYVHSAEEPLRRAAEVMNLLLE